MRPTACYVMLHVHPPQKNASSRRVLGSENEVYTLPVWKCFIPKIGCSNSKEPKKHNSKFMEFMGRTRKSQGFSPHLPFLKRFIGPPSPCSSAISPVPPSQARTWLIMSPYGDSSWDLNIVSRIYNDMLIYI